MGEYREDIVNLLYLISAVLFVLGIKRLSAVRTARQGNLLSMIGMAIAMGVTIFEPHVQSYELIVAGFVVGGLAGALLAVKTPMTGMPQMVALLNGFGGLASLLVASAEYVAKPEMPAFTLSTTALSVIVGGVTFTGSVIAFGKLQGLVTEKAVNFRGQHIINLTLLVLGLALGGVLLVDDFSLRSIYDSIGIVGPPKITLLIVLASLSLLLGVLVVIPIGGADMPVVISLLNSYSGIAAALTGFVLSNMVLIVTGALVGASGIILTQIMCKSMNRSLLNVIMGGFGNAPVASGPAGVSGADIVVKEIGVEECAMVFDSAQSCIIVPGYGMAVAQAQHVVRELSELLEKRGCVVKFAIHPVAGRMPGHMNVLLAEANVPYEKLYEMDAINEEFANTDVALVIGANDVTNPSARHVPSSPIYGMPILNTDKARTVVVVKRSLKPGYAGIDNELYGYPNCLMYLGDAKDAVAKLVAEIKSNS
ncbi:MAG: NAD(P)(+) transhydrogenase (Re/Si-specific) subunit beta [Leptospirales bacterium]|nr:NAD(P)(+) transhydrogenase (Re/Si-specific) subunit beta [Leptospirales bacterium]